MKEGKPASIAFLPSAKDEDKLSGYDGGKVSPGDSHRHFTGTLGFQSAAVFGLAEEECVELDLPIVPSPLENHPHHVHLDFSPVPSKGAKRGLAKKLRDFAHRRGVLYSPPV